MKKHLMELFLATGLVLLPFGGYAQYAHYVDVNSAAPVAPYTNWTTAATGIQQAVDVSISGDSILITNGTYLLSAEISVTNNIRIESVNGPEVTIVDGGGSNRCFNLGNSACIISGLKITNGFTAENGGGVYCASTNPIVANCVISGNYSASWGGGMIWGTANDCAIIGNSASWNGGGMCRGIANNCIFMDNSAGHEGGGIFFGTATNCLIMENAAEDGGGVYSGTANKCAITGNSAEDGGGGMCRGIANNCTITGNSAYRGGGIYSVTATHCTILENSASSYGGGMCSGTANNTIIWYNTAREASNLDRVSAAYSCSPDVQHGVDGNSTNAPMLLFASHIASNSPCRAAGNPAFSSGTDIDGQVWQNPPSIGCDEPYEEGSLTGAIKLDLFAPSSSFSAGYPVGFTVVVQGAIIETRVAFGDGKTATNALYSFEHTWEEQGDYAIVFTAFNDSYPDGVSVTQTVHVVSEEVSTIYVSGTQGNDAADGLSWATAKRTIQAGVDAQNLLGGRVLLTNGTYVASTEIIVGKGIRLIGMNGPEVTIVEGGGTNRCFNLENSPCVLTGITITNGVSAEYWTGSGGGIYCSGNLPVITNCVISGNSASRGGGITGGTANNCTVSDNVASTGGGMYGGVANDCAIKNNTAYDSGGGMAEGTANNCVITGNSAHFTGGDIRGGGGLHRSTANNCTISGNYAPTGAGIDESVANNCTISGNIGNGIDNYSTAHNCTISGNTARGVGYTGKAYYCTISGNLDGGMYGGTAYHCMIIGNSTRRDGGGMYESAAFNCTIRGNSAGLDGGGMSRSSAYNCAILDNTAHGNGGGIHESNAKNCTITGNSAFAGGGGYGSRRTGGVYNSVIWNNTANLGANLYDVDVSFCCSPDLEHGVDGNITNSPLLISAFHISTNSPCRGAGSVEYATGTDLYGEAWLNPPSMGCDEIHGVVTGAVHSVISGPQRIRAGCEANYAVDLEGAITGYQLDFGDGTILTNAILSTIHTWSVPGVYNMILIAFNEAYPEGIAMTQRVEVVSAADSTIHVSDASGDDLNDGLSWSAARKTIQSGVDALDVYGGIVLVSNGTYIVDSEVFVSKDIKIKSLNGPDVTTVAGGGYNRCFNLGISACVIDGFTIANGYSEENGGGIYCGNHTPCITNCMIVGNTSASSYGYNYPIGYGGGLYFGTVYNCVFTGNSATSGGGMAGSIAKNCSVMDNSATFGGGMYDGTAYNCTLIGNSATESGGGIYRPAYDNAFNKVYNCIIWYNTANTDENLNEAGAAFSCSPDLEHGIDGNITNAPLLISSFHIATNSPCRGAGNPTYAAGTDFGGEAWLSPPSMGCDEITREFKGTVHLSISGPTRLRVGMDATYLAHMRGAVTGYLLNFGDGVVLTNAILPITHAWNYPGAYEMTLTAFNADYPEGTDFTQRVEVVSDMGSIIYVSGATGNDLHDGLSWSTAKQHIQAGVDAHDVYGGIVLVSNGTYVVDSEVIVTKAITIQSLNGPEFTEVDGGGNSRCFYLGHKDGVLSGVTITNGYVGPYPSSGFGGGGVYCRYRDSSMTNCTITGNSATDGGGVYNGTANNCLISGNSAVYRGGGINFGAANNSTISGNSAYLGGGMYEGAAYNCIINGNSASSGGGMNGSKAYNCVISSNSASYVGGGVDDSKAYNCTITGNSASEDGGGMSYFSVAYNCVISSNSAGSSGNDVYGGTTSFSFISGDPLFIDAANGDFTLQSNSPCINAGYNEYVVGTTDVDGNARVVYGVVDIGAHEYVGPVHGLPDFDGDGLADTWEGSFFGSVAENPGGNADYDAFSNIDEFIAGTDPTNAASYFRTTISNSAVSGSDHLVITWEAMPERVYNIYWAPSLMQEFHPLEIGIPYPQNSYTDRVHTVESSGFYRVIVMRADYDADGDGLPNEWERRYGVTNAFSDVDNDGFNNISEYIAGTDPTNGTSYFMATGSVAENNGTNGFVVEWISIPDRTYSIEWSTNLAAGFQTLEAGIEHPQNSYIDTSHHTASNGFYKVDVRLK